MSPNARSSQRRCRERTGGAPSGGQGQQAIRWCAARAAEAANGCQAPQPLAQFDECELTQPVNMPHIKLALGAKADPSQRVLFVCKLPSPTL